jgi:hypothetical protein
MNNLRRLAGAYLLAKEEVILAGFAAEIDWQESRCIATVSETEFLREAAWVVLSVGMRETVIRKIFTPFSIAFQSWESAEAISLNRSECCRAALEVFRHRPKVEAIAHICEEVARRGFEATKSSLISDEGVFLRSLPYMGAASFRHLAKNLGLPFAKPDRHLNRIAAVFRYDSSEALCTRLSRFLEEPVQVIDVVLWRFATLRPQYLQDLLDAYWSGAD